MIPRLLENVGGSWREEIAAQGVDLAFPLEAAQIRPPAGTGRKVVFLVFGGEGKEPLLLLKMMRSQMQQQEIRREHSILETLWQKPVLQESVPRPLGLFEDGERLVLAEQFLRGTPLSALLRQKTPRPEGVAIHLERVRRWLGRLQSEETDRAERFAGWEQVAGRLAQLPAEARVTGAFEKRLRDLADRYDGVQLPLVPAHGDYWPGNIFWRSGSMAVADWESYCPARSPWFDYFLFLTAYVEAFGWGRWRRPDRSERFRRGFLSDTWLARLVASSMRAQMEQWNLPGASAEVWYPLFLLEMATPGHEAGEKRRRQAKAWQKRLQQYATVGQLPALMGAG